MTSVVPHAALRDRIAAIDLVEVGGGGLRVLPTSGAVLGIQLHGRVRAREGLLSTAGVTGIQAQARDYTYVGDTSSLLIRFTPQGATCLGVPASELASRSVALDELLAPARVREARARLCEAATVRERVAIVEALLLALPFTRDRLVERAIELLSTGEHEGGRVAAVARALSLSERQLERRFTQRVGVTPKRFASLRRFERAVALAAEAPSLTSLALAAGYCDQSHFIREFRRFAGASPGRVLGRRAGAVLRG